MSAPSESIARRRAQTRNAHVAATAAAVAAAQRNAERAEEIVFFRSFGMSDERIAERLGLSFHALHRWMNRHGVPTQLPQIKET